MRYLWLLLGGLPLGWWLLSTVPPADSQAEPPPIVYDVADCPVGQPPIRRVGDGQATALAKPLDVPLPPLRCAQPRTPQDHAAEAQVVLQQVLAAAPDLGPQPRMVGPFRPAPGQLRQLLSPRAMQAHQFTDRGGETWYLIECYCDSTKLELGLRLGFAQLLLLRLRDDTPGIQYHTLPFDDGIARLTQGAINSRR